MNNMILELAKAVQFNEKSEAQAVLDYTGFLQMLDGAEDVEDIDKKFIRETIKEITALKAELQKTDYKAFKFAEGFISPGDYEPIKQYRNNLRLEINNLENIGE